MDKPTINNNNNELDKFWRFEIGDRYHACVSSEDLRPPEGTECEKRIIKHFDKANSLPAR
jgi:hypothetical protein